LLDHLEIDPVRVAKPNASFPDAGSRKLLSKFVHDVFLQYIERNVLFSACK